MGPVNTLTMLTDYIDPAERAVACPNQDVVYGNAIIALDESPVVLQVPDFGDRFWVYQVVDSRTDSFAELRKMYGTRPGFYLLVGPNWVGTVPHGISKVFASQTGTGVVVPRVFREDTPQDLAAVQPVINEIGLYPVAEFDGRSKVTDWRKVPVVSNPSKGGESGNGGDGAETRWVRPLAFRELLPAVLADAKPLLGESARYSQVLAVAPRGSSKRPCVARVNRVDHFNALALPTVLFVNFAEEDSLQIEFTSEQGLMLRFDQIEATYELARDAEREPIVRGAEADQRDPVDDCTVCPLAE